MRVGEALSAFTLIVAATLNFACAYILNLAWRLEVYYFVLISFGVSLLVGVLEPNLKRSIVFTYLSALLGAALALLVMLFPTLLFEPELLDPAITVGLSCISRLVILGFAVNLFGVLLGYFLGGT